tara:strand:+ start:3046 stop:3654 length:609 start_codon:yes stop_codon:yes gene_type:complete
MKNINTKNNKINKNNDKNKKFGKINTIKKNITANNNTNTNNKNNIILHVFNNLKNDIQNYDLKKKLFNNYNFEKFNVLSFIDNLNTNKLFIGIIIIFMNIGTRHIEIKLTKTQEKIFKSVAREILIFSIAFIGTRDIILSFIITAAFIVLSQYVFNENSRFNILPKKLKQLESSLDTNNDGKISQEEIDKALKILKDANKNK